MRARDAAFEQAHQRAVGQPGLGQLQAHQRHAQTLGGGIAGQADIVEGGAVHGLGPVQIVRGKPGAPRLQRAAQQLGVLQVLHRAEGAEFLDAGGRGQRGNDVLHDADRFQIRIAAGAVADGQVGIFGHHVEQRNVHVQRQVDLGVGRGELAQARHQDAAREGGGDGHAQLAARQGRIAAGEALQHGQRLAHVREIFAALGGEGEIGAAKEAHAHQLFQLLDAVADRAGRDAEFFGGVGDATEPGQGFEGEKALDRRNAHGHGGYPCLQSAAR